MVFEGGPRDPFRPALSQLSIRRDAGATVRSRRRLACGSVKTVAEYERIHPQTRAEWRDWLETHHDRSPGAWVIQWRTATGRRRLSYEDLVEEGLCFGWIDSKARKLDDERSMITMTPRRPTSVWSRSNKERVARLTAEGR